MRRWIAYGAVVAAIEAFRRWRPRTMHVSRETVDGLIKRQDRSGEDQVNDKDPHPFAVERLSVTRGNR